MATEVADSPASTSHIASIVSSIQAEITDAAKLGGQAVASLAWTWPIRGLIYSMMSEYLTHETLTIVLMNITSSSPLPT